MDVVDCLLWMWVYNFCISCTQVNVALEKNATTTSGAYQGWEPSGAVDGDHDKLDSSSSCFHSAASPAYWTVDLGHRYQLYNINVYLRSNFAYRTADSIVYVDKDKNRVCYTFPSIISDNPQNLTCNTTARYVTIKNPGKQGIDYDSLNICEVEIYACSQGYHGLDCNLNCHCDECDRWTGICNTTCRSGWVGLRCDKACNGTYGTNCINSCDSRHCSNSFSSCDPVNGTCDSGCQRGWTGLDCMTKCQNSTYGLKCSENCTSRHCLDYSTCDHATGSCALGCQPGWTSTDCTEVCNGTYGINCTNSCETRHCSNSSSFCDSVNGTCDSGCLAGWTGNDCFTRCQSSTYGLNCSKNCTDRHCVDKSTCEHVTGSCDLGCEPGWTSADCTQACNGTYGSNCTNSCDARHCSNSASSCDPVNGTCDSGCLTGWTGQDCFIASAIAGNVDVTTSTGVGLIAGSAAAGVLVVLVVVLLTVFVIRRKKKKSSTKSSAFESHNYAKARKEGTHQTAVYENFALQEDDENETKKRKSHIDIKVVQLATSAPAQTTKGDKKGKDVVVKHVENNQQDNRCTQEEEEEEVEEELYEEGNVKDIYNTPKVEAEEKNYYNLNQVDSKNVVSVSQLPQRIKEMEKNPSMVMAEYEALPQEFLYAYEESQKRAYKGKNRFKGYYPYDYNRVILLNSEDGTVGDYINASYIDGYMAEKHYIAAQGPYKTELFEDFWRMVWQEGCTAIVMVTSLVEAGKMKCLRYWPENVTEKYGSFTVTTEKKTQLADYTITNLVVQHDQQPKRRHVRHFYFTSWSDHGVPDISGLLTFMQSVQNFTKGQKQPVIVHCSAGIGRTGTYIAVESLVNQAATEGVVDVVSFVTNMRGQRRNMVQTMDQYHFIYKAVSHAVTYGDTSLSIDFIKYLNLDRVAQDMMGNKTVEEHLQILQSMMKDEEPQTGLILLPSYRKRCGFTLITSGIDREEILNLFFNGDLRILITDNSCKEELFSSDTDVTFTKGRELSISGDVTLRNIEMTKQDGETTIQIEHYHVQGKMNERTVSVLTDSLLQGKGQPEGQATAVVSRSSETECGVLVLLLNLVSRLKEEGRTDIILEMTRLQQRIPYIKFNMGHVCRCLEFAKRWIESIEMYANI